MSEIDPPRESELDPPREKVSLHELAWTFNHIALASFGGGLSAWSREFLEVENQWMGEAEFLSAMTICRILPGANQVNIAVFAGSKMRGLPGVVAALFGLCLMPVVLIMVMGFFYFRFKEVPAVKGYSGRKCLTGVVPVLLFVAAFVLNGVARWPLPLVLLLVAPLSLIWAWPGERPA